jgi:hypothetical protein
MTNSVSITKSYHLDCIEKEPVLVLKTVPQQNTLCGNIRNISAGGTQTTGLQMANSVEFTHETRVCI